MPKSSAFAPTAPKLPKRARSTQRLFHLSLRPNIVAQASENTLHAMLFAIGGLGIISSIWDFSVSGTLLTIILGAFVTGTFGISYLAHKQAAS